MNYIQKKNRHLFLKFTYYAFTAFVTISLIYFFKLLFMPIAVSILLTLIFDPIVILFETRGFKRIPIIVCIYIFLTLIVVGGIIGIIPKLISEGQTIARNIPQYQNKFKESILELQVSLEKKFPDADIPDLNKFLEEKIGGTKNFNMGALFNYLSSFFAILSVFVIVPILTFFFLADGYVIQKAILRLSPNRYFEMFVLLFHNITKALKLFLRGQLIDAAAVGILTSIGLACIGLPYFLVIGIIAGLGNLIPYLGPIIGFVPALLVTAMSPEGLGLIPLAKIFFVFVLVQFVEGTFIYPIAVGKSVNLHPLVVIIGVTVGGQIGGIIGMLIAIPLISIVKVTFEVLHSYLKDYAII